MVKIGSYLACPGRARAGYGNSWKVDRLPLVELRKETVTWSKPPVPGGTGGSALAEAALPLQNLDLIAVRIGNEEKAGEPAPIMVEIDEPARRPAGRLEAAVLAFEICDHHRQIAVAVARRIGFGASLVDRQFDLEIGLGIAQIDQRERLEVEPVGQFEAESVTVERDRAGLVQNPDHAVNGLGQTHPRCRGGFVIDRLSPAI